MKSSLVLASLLLFASAAQAQHSQGSFSGGGNTIGFGNNVGGWGGGWGWGSLGSHGRPVRYEDPRSFELVYVRNDGPFIPTTYMSYEEAVALGQQQLAAAEKASQGDGTLSLGEVARSYRAGHVPTMKLQSRVLQDNAGKLEVCNLNGNDCHHP